MGPCVAGRAPGGSRPSVAPGRVVRLSDTAAGARGHAAGVPSGGSMHSEGKRTAAGEVA